MVLYRDAAPLLARVDVVRTEIVVATLSAAAIVAVLLHLVFRTAQRRIREQTVALVEASRRDHLTGLLNHGAVVGELAELIEQARGKQAPVGVALVDLDGIRLLNKTHGFPAGDEALVRVARRLSAGRSGDMVLGRYGPDEFLVIAPARDIADLAPLIQRVRNELVDESLTFGAGERLPITISAGIVDSNEKADSMTDLLALASVVLAEAKASGGDAVRTAADHEEAAGTTRSFDVLQGLVIAVDTKDRYTKRHSEDVARYAAFLAEQMGLDPDFQATTRVAGLLHDVGKIGIPDSILRKPGRLSAEDFEVVKQHVVLGDAIVRNVAHAELVRAGIRHHHERWDGHGYLHALAGEDIPLIARILAVADAFSAMTTTRPYRKALSLREALTRLGDAAGTQLDEDLVSAFIRGIETSPAAPLPGSDPTPIPIRLPQASVA
jgi:diguanylate cyclase (GGDEF)-like protein/putative nucleotidyltransferase with HDIG domain